MKTTLNKAYSKVLSAFSLTLNKFNDMASVKGGRALVQVGISFLAVIGLHTTSAKVRSIVVFLRKLSHYYLHNGRKGACLILKVYAVTLQQSIGGHVVKDLGLLKFRVKRTRGGLPRVIPVIHRNMIRDGETGIIRFWLSLFNLYRLVTFKGDYTVTSITKSIVSPAKTADNVERLKGQLVTFVPTFYLWLKDIIGLNPRSLQIELSRNYRRAQAFPIMKANPLTAGTHKFEDLTRLGQQEAMLVLPVVSTHPLMVHEAAVHLDNNLELRGPVRYFLDLLPEGNVLRNLYIRCNHFPLKKGHTSAMGGWADRGLAKAGQDPLLLVKRPFRPVLGKLSLKEEAAGKVRVFAMVDCWTQWLMKPLHSVIFDHILDAIPQDGTKDQLAPVRSLLRRDPSCLFSLDLSSATDRLPLWLQQAIIAGMINPEFAQNWADLLVKRDYSILIPHHKTGFGERHRIRYSVGQPMGALSSWASLALTHHFIVQFCAYTVGFEKWFTEYAVLGDDIVIANAKVANQYLEVMRVLGVGIGLHKSLLSGAGTALEFAKRTFFKGVDVSPIPLTELVSSFNSPSSAVSFINKYGLTLASFLKAAGHKFRVLGKLHKPLGQLSNKVRLIILAMNIPIEIEDVEKFFELGMPKSGRSQFETQAVIDQMLSSEFKLIQRAVNAQRTMTYDIEGRTLQAKFIAHELVERLEGDTLDPGALELLNWAQAQFDNKTHLDHWTKGEGFIMSPVYEDSLGLTFKTALDVADANPQLVLDQAKRLYEASLIKQTFPLIKEIETVVIGASFERARVIATAVKEEVTRVMLAKYEMTAAEMYIALIRLNQQLQLAPMANLQYSLVIDAAERRFTDGTHIRLWKALSGLAQNTKQPDVNQKKVEDSKESDDPFGWFS
jgi:hypothetical protein